VKRLIGVLHFSAGLCAPPERDTEDTIAAVRKVYPAIVRA
jgi:hypothetical protein